MKWDKALFDKAQAEVIATLRGRGDEADREYGDLLAASTVEEYFVSNLLTGDLPPNKIAYLLARQFLTNLKFVCDQTTNGDSLMMLTVLGILKSIEGVTVRETTPEPFFAEFPPTGGLPN